MNKRIYLRSLFLWILFIPIAIINGTIRNFVYAPLTGELAAHQISTLIMVIVFFIVGYLMLKNIILKYSYRETFIAGIFLLMLTIFFEFGFGHYVMGHSWEKLLHDYNFMEGRIWVLVLIAIFITPSLTKFLKNRA